MKQTPTSTAGKKNQIRGLLRRSTFEAPLFHPIVDEVFYTTLGGAFNVRSLAERIQDDEILTGGILEICRLPYYSGKTPIRNLNQVIHRLGAAGLRAVTLQAYLDIEVYQSDIWEAQMKQLRTYSVIVGQICRVIARYLPLDGEDAFMCGLLHRIGFAVGLQKVTPKGDSRTEIWDVLEISHSVFGKMVCQAWGLKESITTSVAHYGQTIVDGETHLYNAAVLVAEELARRFRFEFRGPVGKDNLRDQMTTGAVTAIELLEIDETLMRKIYMDAHFVLSHGLQLNV